MDWKSAIGKIAPVLGTALGGPLGGAAVSAIASALGLSESTEEAVKQAIQGMTPEQAVALKRADQEFALEQLKEKNRAIEALEKQIIDDRASARDLAKIEAVQDKTPWWMPTRRTILAFIAVLGFLGSLSGLFYIALTGQVIDTGAKDILVYALGCLTGMVTSVYSFDFGSTQGSQRKDEIISRSNPPIK